MVTVKSILGKRKNVSTVLVLRIIKPVIFGVVTVLTKIKVEVFASAFTKMKGIQILGSFFCVFKWRIGGGGGGAVSAATGER